MWRQLACLAVLLVATSVQAQQIRANAPKFALLTNDAVVKELKLSDEQQGKIKEVLGDCVQEIDGQKRLVINGQTDVEAMEADCLKVLNEKQNKRLREAWLQVNGAMVITDEQISKELKITEEQGKKARESVQRMNEDLLELFKSGVDMKEQVSQIKEIRNNTKKKIESYLTKVQQTKLTELQGTKIEGLIKP